MTWLLTGEEFAAVKLSVQVAFLAMLFSAPLAIIVAYILARWRFPGHGLLNLLVHMPLILPPVVTGYLLMIMWGPSGQLGSLLLQWGVPLAYHWHGAVLAAAVMAFPLFVRAVRLSFEAIDIRLEHAAATLGASPWRIWWSVTLPLALPGIWVGAILGFAKALGEFGATITFAGNMPGLTQTLPSAIYSLLQTPQGEERLVILCAVSIVIALLALMVCEWLGRWAARRTKGL